MCRCTLASVKGMWDVVLCVWRRIPHGRMHARLDAALVQEGAVRGAGVVHEGGASRLPRNCSTACRRDRVGCSIGKSHAGERPKL